MKICHMHTGLRFVFVGLVVGFAFALEATAQTSGGAPTQLKVQPAQKSSAATKAPILGACMAGKRLVAVGDYGTILLSDDDGKTFRQAMSVPVSSTLTAVSFFDEHHGWAVGHWGVVLHTSDGGEHWEIQRLDTSTDRPLFSVHFFDQQKGIAVGLWSLVLTTHNGGKTWETVALPPPPEGGKGDRNLFKIFAAANGTAFVAAERGTVLKSEDQGKSWSYLSTGYNGSFWSGVALRQGPLLVAGLRGTIYRSTDGGRTWSPVASTNKSSVTDLVEVDEKIIAVGLDGVQLESLDQGATFSFRQRDDRLSLTAAVATGSSSLVSFSKKGVVGMSTSSNAAGNK